MAPKRSVTMTRFPEMYPNRGSARLRIAPNPFLGPPEVKVFRLGRVGGVIGLTKALALEFARAGINRSLGR